MKDKYNTKRANKLNNNNIRTSNKSVGKGQWKWGKGE